MEDLALSEVLSPEKKLHQGHDVRTADKFLQEI